MNNQDLERLLKALLHLIDDVTKIKFMVSTLFVGFMAALFTAILTLLKIAIWG